MLKYKFLWVEAGAPLLWVPPPTHTHTQEMILGGKKQVFPSATHTGEKQVFLSAGKPKATTWEVREASGPDPPPAAPGAPPGVGTQLPVSPWGETGVDLFLFFMLF